MISKLLHYLFQNYYKRALRCTLSLTIDKLDLVLSFFFEREGCKTSEGERPEVIESWFYEQNKYLFEFTLRVVGVQKTLLLKEINKSSIRIFKR